MTITENPFNQEIILHEDGKFYKRSTITTLIDGANEALANIQIKPQFHVCPVRLPAINNLFGVVNNQPAYITEYIKKDNHLSKSKQLAVFVPINGYYFRGASLIKFFNPENNNDDEHYSLRIAASNRPYPASETTENKQIIDGRSLSKPVCWSPPTLSLYFMLPFKSSVLFSNYEEDGSPVLFAYDRYSRKSYIPNIPNVYDRGGICTGDNYPAYYKPSTTREMKDSSDLIGLVSDQLNHINDSLCNNDLRSPEVDKKYVRFTENGTTVDMLNNEAIKKSDEQFYLPATNEKIMDFTKWIS